MPLTSSRLVHLRPCIAWLAAGLIIQSTTPAAFALPQDPAPAELRITIVEGDNAIVNTRQRVGREAIIQVEDENHKPVGGALVTLLAPRSGAGVTFSNGASTINVTTNAQGRAVFQGIRPNTTAGRFQIQVTAEKGSLKASTTMQWEIQAPPASTAKHHMSGKTWAIIGVVAAAAVAGAVLATRGDSPAPPPPATGQLPGRGNFAPGGPRR